MFRREDGRLLKTKIVATLGAAQTKGFLARQTPGYTPRTIHGLNGRSLTAQDSQTESQFWDEFLGWFFTDSMFMIDVARLNMAFFDPLQPHEQESLLKWLRSRRERARNLAVLADLAGPKLRVRELPEEGLTLVESTNKRDTVRFRTSEGRGNGDPMVCVCDAPLLKENPSAVQELRHELRRKGQIRISLGETAALLSLEKIDGDDLICVVKKGGHIVNGKGISFLDMDMDLRSFTDADRTAIDFLVDYGIDWTEDMASPESCGSVLAFVGVSFAKTERDIIEVKRYLHDRIVDRLLSTNTTLTPKDASKRADQVSPSIIAKIETRRAVGNIRAILDFADGAMVARGDLAQQLGPECVPAEQRRLIRLCNARGKPVITATQMLHSMINSPEPTRAEANDVFTAIRDGTDAVMLSDETANGCYPFRAVQMMVRIAQEAEKHIEGFGHRERPSVKERRQLNEQRFQHVLATSEAELPGNTNRLLQALIGAITAEDQWLIDLCVGKLWRSRRQEITDRVSMSACVIANSSDDYMAIIAGSASGRTARMISRFRPDIMVIGAAHDVINRLKMLMSFGVFPVNCGRNTLSTGVEFVSTEDMLDAAFAQAVKEGYVSELDSVVFTAGVPVFKPGSTNLIKIRDRVPSDLEYGKRTG